MLNANYPNKRAPDRRKKFFTIKGRQVDDLSIFEVKNYLKLFPLKKIC